MTTINVVCKLNKDDGYKILADAMYLNLSDKQNCHYTFWNTGKNYNSKLLYLPNFFSNEGLDLFYISLFVFYADRTINREMFPDAWTRKIKLYIPVLAIEKWNSQKCLLKELLSFLSGDIWDVEFRPRTLNCIENSFIKKQKKKKENKISSKTFCMLSGGLDSFIGAIDLLEKVNNITFINHYGGGPSGSKYIKSVEKVLADKYLDNNIFNVFKFHASVINGKEDSTRTRSFMFFAHAIVLASTIENTVELYIPENGLISLNIPLTNSRLGSSSTRTTHPYYLKLLQILLDKLNIHVKLKNPYQFYTKGEMISKCSNYTLLKDNINKTMSCSHPDQGRYNHESGPKHCGICLPCVIRRAAILRADLIDFSEYRDEIFNSGKQARNNFKAYKLGLLKWRNNSKSIYSHIQTAGPLDENLLKYADLYKRGMAEISRFIGDLNVE